MFERLGIVVLRLRFVFVGAGCCGGRLRLLVRRCRRSDPRRDELPAADSESLAARNVGAGAFPSDAPVAALIVFSRQAASRMPTGRDRRLAWLADGEQPSDGIVRYVTANNPQHGVDVAER